MFVKIKYKNALVLIRHLFLCIVILGVSSVFNDLLSQNVQTKPTRQSSLEAFSKGNYEKAYTEFKDLLTTYSKDPMYNYYSGVCLIKLNRSPEEAVSLLNQALKSTSAVKTLPSDVLFWLARGQQMKGSFNEALESYNLFTDQAGRKTSRELGVPEYIHQCNEKKGAVVESVTKPVDKINTGANEINKSGANPAKIDVAANPAEVKTSQVSVIPQSSEKILGEALNLQYKSDSLSSLAAGKKSELNKLPDSEKPAMKAKISETELYAGSLQKSADQKYKEAELTLNPPTEKPARLMPVQKPVVVAVSDSTLKLKNTSLGDTLKKSDNKVVTNPIAKSDTLSKIMHEANKPPEAFTYFEVLPKPVTDPKVKIEIDPEVPSGLIYRIQVAVFRNPVAPAYFKGITPVFGFRIPGTDKTNYYVGMFRRSTDAAKALGAVKAKGFKDSFIVALLAKKVVSADRAAILEKEWGKIPFIGTAGSVAQTAPDTIPPALSFRVEVIRSDKPLKADVVQGIEKMAGNRGFDIQPLSDGTFAYLIGNFITFDSAAEYSDLLTRNGYREAHVVAFLGKKEIPVETAKQLIETVR